MTRLGCFRTAEPFLSGSAASEAVSGDLGKLCRVPGSAQSGGTCLVDEH